MDSDLSLLRQYATQGSHQAFAALVARHIDMVHSAALRQTGGHALAEDVTQAVFTLLARKAASLGDERYLSAWLLVCARNMALDTLRRESRRQAHERKAAEMAEKLKSADSSWSDIAPLLDEALALLASADREVIILRYFKGQSTREIATALGASPDAAKQRVHRALDKLRAIFAGRGVVVAPALLIRNLSAHAIAPAPAHLAAALASISTTTAATVTKGAGFLMAMTNAKLVVAALVVIVSAGVAAVVKLKAGPPPQPVAGIPIIPAADVKEADAPNEDPNAWRKAFDEAYGLREGQAARLVPPPYIPERQKFWDTGSSNGRVFPLHPKEHFIMHWQGKTPKWLVMSLGPEDLSFYLSSAVELKPYEFADWDAAGKLKLSGDWVIRREAALADKLAAAEDIVKDTLDKKIHFEQRRITREVIIAAGHFEFKNANPDIPPSIDYAADDADHGPPLKMPTVSLRYMFDLIEQDSRKQVIDQSDANKRIRFELRNSAPGPQRIKDTLEHLSKQTGLTFTTEKREMEVWFLVEQ